MTTNNTNTELGLTVTVIGQVAPYVITDAETGEIVSGANIMYPGGKVGVALSPEIAHRLKEGQLWRFSGRATVSGSGKLRIAEITAAKQLKAEAIEAAAAFEWLDEAPSPVKAKS